MKKLLLFLMSLTASASTIQSVPPEVVHAMPNGPAYVVKLGGTIMSCPAEYGVYLAVINPKAVDALPTGFQYVAPGSIIQERPGQTFQMACLKVVK